MNKHCAYCKEIMPIKNAAAPAALCVYECPTCQMSLQYEYDISYRELYREEDDKLVGVTFGIEKFYVILNIDLAPVYGKTNYTHVYKNVLGKHISQTKPIFEVPGIISFPLDNPPLLLEKLKLYTLFS